MHLLKIDPGGIELGWAVYVHQLCVACLESRFAPSTPMQPQGQALLSHQSELVLVLIPCLAFQFRVNTTALGISSKGSAEK